MENFLTETSTSYRGWMKWKKSAGVFSDWKLEKEKKYQARGVSETLPENI